MIAIMLGLVLTLAPAPLGPTTPQIIAHRGASGERPEHTRAAYELAIDQGADVIEPDLVMTSDGHLVLRHENEIGETTNVADKPEFASRRATRTIDGVDVTGWFTEDFTLAELKTLRAKERLPQMRGTAFDGREALLTFDEVLDIAEAASARTGRRIGVAPELKHPTYFIQRGLPVEDAFVAVLERRGLTGPDAPVLVQCFEVGTLERLSQRVDTPLLQLMQASGGPFDKPDTTYAQMATPEGLARIATYARSIGVDTGMILPPDEAGRSAQPTALVEDAHTAGLKVVVWTFRAENAFLPLEHRSNGNPSDHGDLTGYLNRFYDLKVDAVFSDFPALATAARLGRQP
ncbi:MULTISPECIES: glycerophosphodiester phosphodiesterase [unclassified Brevundimonas]|uniref:glycerophosphodiester phosphodiesterase n=1 Tax=unclassified Brevundimonas TaxID=2622653 RepID=UPI0025BD129A|nr:MULTISPECIES: glycerophosphodiester phosphodiesterase [unclassified Brevundimonas]